MPRYKIAQVNKVTKYTKIKPISEVKIGQPDVNIYRNGSVDISGDRGVVDSEIL